MPVEIEAHTVPHFKATINTKVWPEQLGSDGISISYKARPKIGHLLHKRGFVYSAHFSGRKCWTFEMSKLYHLVFCQNKAKTKYFPLKMKIFIHGLFRN